MSPGSLQVEGLRMHFCLRSDHNPVYRTQMYLPVLKLSPRPGDNRQHDLLRSLIDAAAKVRLTSLRR